MRESIPLPHPASALHVAVIMDGNGRWGEARGVGRSGGHRAGVEALRRLVTAAIEQGVATLTVYAFSSDNWRRPPAEVAVLMRLLATALAQEARRLAAQGVRLSVIGRRDRLAPSLAAAIARGESRTAGGRTLHLRVAIDYSGREAIRGGATGPDVDLLIRTGGEKRLSDFLLWESAYAELHFTSRLWPDFTAADLEAALADFERRDRRFGALSAPAVDGPAAPAGLAFGPGGERWVADPTRRRLWRFGAGEAPEFAAGAASWVEAEAPTVVRACGEAVVVLEQDPHGARLVRWGASGRELLYQASSREQLLDFALTAAGEVLVAIGPDEEAPARVATLVDGALAPLFAGDRDGAPDLALAAGPTGTVYLLQGRVLWRYRAGRRERWLEDPAIAIAAADAGGLAVSPSGALCLTRSEADAVCRIDAGTGAIRQWTLAAPWDCACVGEGCLHQPGYPAFDAAGRLWVVDAGRQRVCRFAEWEVV